jgi:electron transfer flavoprotein alpha/beta subunit
MRRNQRLPVVMSVRERQALARLADFEGLSAAAVVRQLIRRAARECGLWPPKDRCDTNQIQTQAEQEVES